MRFNKICKFAFKGFEEYKNGFYDLPSRLFMIQIENKWIFIIDVETKYYPLFLPIITRMILCRIV